MLEFLKFLIFLIASHLGAMQIFRLTTYHAYFWKAVPLLAVYSGLVGWLLWRFGMHSYFLWQVILVSMWLVRTGRKNAAMAQDILATAGEDADTVRTISMSLAKSMTFYKYSSAMYVITFSAVYLWCYNR